MKCRRVATRFPPLAISGSLRPGVYKIGNGAHTTARNFGETIDLLTGVVQEINTRTTGDYTNPTTKKPGILAAIDDADAVLRNKRAAHLAADIVERGGPVGVGLIIATTTVDPADYASNTNLLLGLAATNTYPLNIEYAEFLHALSNPEAN